MQELKIRPAKIQDQKAVDSLCTGSFPWGDYLPEVFGAWLQDDTGQVLVAQVEEEVVGLVRLVSLSAEEGWLEGMRIHPDWRRHGLASELTCHARDALLSQGVDVVRLAIGNENTPSQRLAGHTGFRPAFSLVEYTTRGGEGCVRAATPGDVPNLLSLIEAGSPWGRPVPRQRAIIGYDWKWSQAKQDTIASLISQEKIWTNDSSWAVVDSLWPGDDEITVHTPYGNPEAITALLGGIYQRLQHPLRVTLVRWHGEEECPRALWSDPEAGDIIYEYREE